MASREIWSRPGSLQIRDLLASLLASALLRQSSTEPLYVCSPFLTDFPLFDNRFGGFRALFTRCPALGEPAQILFSDVLAELSHRQPVRVIGLPGEHADVFFSRTVRHSQPGIEGRYASKFYHEKGLLDGRFYLEGSMNFTYSGVYHRDEKVNVYTPDADVGRRKIAAATLEMARLWDSRAAAPVSRT